MTRNSHVVEYKRSRSNAPRQQQIYVPPPTDRRTCNKERPTVFLSFKLIYILFIYFLSLTSFLIYVVDPLHPQISLPPLPSPSRNSHPLALKRLHYSFCIILKGILLFLLIQFLRNRYHLLLAFLFVGLFSCFEFLFNKLCGDFFDVNLDFDLFLSILILGF